MSPTPIIVEHEMACGTYQGRDVRTSILEAAAAVLFARGADEILVPVPTGAAREAVEIAVSELADERRGTIRLIDSGGSLLRRIDDFLEPLTAYAVKWPEDAFVNFSRVFLYHLALATKAKAGVAHDSVNVVRGFVPILDVRVFRGEGRYRLAELISLIAAYEPMEAPEGVIAAPLAVQATRNSLMEILESTEFRRLAATSGLLGYLTDPAIALRRLARMFRRLLEDRRTQSTLGLAASVADTGSIGPIAKGVDKLLDIGRDVTRPFAPPFLPLDVAKIGIYRVALSDRYPSAQPPAGTAMVLERALGGVSWLNEGEEYLRYPPLSERLARRKDEAIACRKVQQQLFS